MSGAADAVRNVAARATSFDQTAFTFGALLFAWLLFITMRGDLARWLGVFGLAGSSGGSPSGALPVTPATQLATPGSGLTIPGIPDLPALPTLGGSGAGSSLTVPSIVGGVSGTGLGVGGSGSGGGGGGGH
jgi:hypothetical protein